MAGSRCQGRKTWTLIDKLLGNQSRQFWELKTPGEEGLQIFKYHETYLQELDQFSLKISERKQFPHACGRVGKRNYFEICQSILFFSIWSVLRGTSSPEPILLGYHQSLTSQDKSNTQLQPIPAILSHPRGVEERKKLRNIREPHSPEAQTHY